MLWFQFFHAAEIVAALTAADQDLLARLHPQNIADMVDIRALNPDFFRPDLVRFHKKMVHDYFFLAVTETHSP